MAWNEVVMAKSGNVASDTMTNKCEATLKLIGSIFEETSRLEQALGVKSFLAEAQSKSDAFGIDAALDSILVALRELGGRLVTINGQLVGQAPCNPQGR